MSEFFPSQIIDIEEIKKSSLNYALVVLNRPILLDRHLAETLWSNSSINVTVDGGTNRWLAYLRAHSLEKKLSHPTLITGDLDSCHPDSLAFFNGAKVVRTVDQDETDFTKCLRVLEPFITQLNLDYIVAICENSGRLDQIVANINTLYKSELKPSGISRPVFMLSATSVSWLLPAGHHEIHIPESVRRQWCALMPIGGPTVVSTEGLKWNMTDFRMEFGGLVSTSNRYDGVSDKARVVCDSPLLWSMGTGCEE